jgi:hypothetical protein
VAIDIVTRMRKIMPENLSAPKQHLDCKPHPSICGNRLSCP